MPESDPPEARNGEPTLDAHAAAAALELAFSRLPQSILMAVIIGFGFVGLLAPFFDATELIAWLCVLAVAYMARAGIWYAWRQTRPAIEHTRRWQIAFAGATIVAGAGWAFGAVTLLPPDGQLETMLLIVAVLIVSATGANTLGAQFVAAVLFVGTAILPVATSLALRDGAVEQMTALALLCCFLVLSIASRQTSRRTYQLIRTELALTRAAADAASARQLAEASSLAKSQFLANMSHEVRTPLNGVLGLAELLAKSTLNVKQRHHIGLLRQSGEHLLHVVNEILDLSKIEAGRLDLVVAEFDLHRLLADCGAMVQPLAERAGLRFECR